MPTKRNVSQGVKKQVAASQHFRCAVIENYSCPLNGNPFDEAGYDIDHIVPLSEGGTNDASNLQALCVSCHRVKSNRASVGPKKKPEAKPKAKRPWRIQDTEIGYLYEASSEDEAPKSKSVMVNGKPLNILQRTH